MDTFATICGITNGKYTNINACWNIQTSEWSSQVVATKTPSIRMWLSKYELVIKDDARPFYYKMNYILRYIHQNLVYSKIVEIFELKPNSKFTIEVKQNGKVLTLEFCIEHRKN